MFDVDDIFNNAVGAVIGGFLAWAAIKSLGNGRKEAAMVSRQTRQGGRCNKKDQG